MGAHMIELDTRCSYGGCTKRATHLVRDRFNGDRGKFCARHGKARLAELQKGEAEDPFARATASFVFEHRRQPERPADYDWINERAKALAKGAK